MYDHYLEGIDDITTPLLRPNSMHSYHLYVIRAKQRNELAQWLKEKGIETAIHYPVALPNLPVYQYLGYGPADFPVATRLQDEILSLPMYPELTEEMIKEIALNIRLFYSNR